MSIQLVTFCAPSARQWDIQQRLIIVIHVNNIIQIGQKLLDRARTEEKYIKISTKTV
ncbi:MAG: hypothetical protein J7L47_04550 [Candidatus Odinarchaeota archaeon]|nr:hypothetical protein [Candidatus Odinarchaeota archaeon]